MRVILNVDAITQPLTGIGRYALNLARGLRRHDAVEDCRFYSAYQWIEDPDKAIEANRIVSSVRRFVPFKTFALTAYFRVRQAIYRQRVGKLKGYLLHAPNYLAFQHDGPIVTTFHDLSHRHYPECHPIERVRIMDREIPKTLQMVSHIITDSEFVRREMMEVYGVGAGDITAVPLGVDPIFRPCSREQTAPILRRYHIDDKPYLLVVATLEPRKNLVRLLLAYAQLSAQLREAYPLVIVGVKGWLTGEIEKIAAPFEAAGLVRRLGYVDEDDLPYLYAGAHAFVFPSLYEGFGLPPLEAMASGVPVLVSNIAAMPEVVGNAGLLADPYDVGQLAYKIEQLLVDNGFRDQARARGVARAAEFTWRRCVDQTVEAYRKACRD